MNIGGVFQRITTALDSAGIEYMLAGSFASTRYSSPRSTQDIDIVISAGPEQLKSLIQDLNGKHYYAEFNDALHAYQKESLFNVIDLETGWKIDLIFRKSTPFGLEEFRRRSRIELHGLSLFVASPEDVIISKLAWAKDGASHRQIEDAAAVLSVQGQSLDMNYLERWISDLGLKEQWDAARGIEGSNN